jgi:arsenate reductase (thioredoxin)
VDEFTGEPFDYVITVCNNARESCPVFFRSKGSHSLEFYDPAAVQGELTERLAAFRNVRNEIRSQLHQFIETSA